MPNQPSVANLEDLKGSTEPRIYTPPKRELTPETSLGFAAIDYSTNVLHQPLYPWQEWALIHMLEIEGDLHKPGGWHFRYRTVVILVARQNGKTVLSKVLASFFLNVLEVKNILGTSLSVDKALEVLDAVIEDQQNVPALSTEIERVVRANGGNKLILKGKRVYKIGAPNQRAGRGDSNDLVILDELREHHNWKVWSATVASTSAKENGLVVAFTNAGDPQSVVLRQVRSQAISEINGNNEDKQNFGGDDIDSLGLFEWSAEDECDLRDPIQIAKANPALGYGRNTLRAILSAQRTAPENDYRAEYLCQTVESLLPAPFPRGAWSALLDTNSEIAPQSEIFYGIDMSPDGNLVSISACGQREDGNYHIEVIHTRRGSEWAIDWFRTRALINPMKLAYQGRGARVCGLAEQIGTLEGVIRIPIEGPDLTNGWTRFYDSIAAGRPLEDGEEPIDGIKTYHLDQPVLDLAAKTMQLKQMGNGLTLPDRGKSPDDITGMFAAAMAFAAATKIDTKTTKVNKSVYTADYTLCII